MDLANNITRKVCECGDPCVAINIVETDQCSREINATKVRPNWAFVSLGQLVYVMVSGRPSVVFSFSADIT